MLWQLNPTKSRTFPTNRMTESAGISLASGLSEGELLQRNKLKEKLLDIIYKEEISRKQKS